MHLQTAAVATSVMARPADFVDLRAQVPGLVQDLRYFTANNFTGVPVPGYEADLLLGTAALAKALVHVQQDLAASGLGLKIFDAYRPQDAVDFFVRWAHDAADIRTKTEYFPRLDKANLFPDGYLVARSSHSRGSTVDLTLIDAGSGKELDMGTPFDFFDPRSWPSAPDVTTAQRKCRFMLRESMQARGFVPVEEEWWHFTLADEPFPATWFNFPIR